MDVVQVCNRFQLEFCRESNRLRFFLIGRCVEESEFDVGLDEQLELVDVVFQLGLAQLFDNRTGCSDLIRVIHKSEKKSHD